VIGSVTLGSVKIKRAEDGCYELVLACDLFRPRGRRQDTKWPSAPDLALPETLLLLHGQRNFGDLRRPAHSAAQQSQNHHQHRIGRRYKFENSEKKIEFIPKLHLVIFFNS
jgi:hypothetical protein